MLGLDNFFMIEQLFVAQIFLHLDHKKVLNPFHRRRRSRSKQVLPKSKIPASGSHKKDAEKSPDPAEKHRKSLELEAVFRPEIVRIFSGGFLSNSCVFRQELAGNHRKKSEKFQAGILLPCSSDFRCFPAETGPYLLTWVVNVIFIRYHYNLSNSC